MSVRLRLRVEDEAAYEDEGETEREAAPEG